jgi:hypothetical protein
LIREGRVMKALARILLVLVPAFVLAIGAAAWWNLRPARVRPRVAGLELQDLGGESLKRWDPTKESPPAPKPILPRRPSVAVGAHDPARPGQPTFLLRRSNVLRKKGESYAYNSESYGATFADGGIDFGLPVQRRPLLSYSFEELRSGREVLARGGAVKPRARADQSEVYFDRGRRSPA